MMDVISSSALVLSIVSALILFVKSIKKCSCNTKGIDFERKVDGNSPGRKQEFTFKLINIIKPSSPKNQKNGGESGSESGKNGENFHPTDKRSLQTEAQGDIENSINLDNSISMDVGDTFVVTVEPKPVQFIIKK